MWRITGFDNYLIFYRPVEGGVEIIRVLHAKRDNTALFGRDGNTPFTNRDRGPGFIPARP